MTRTLAWTLLALAAVSARPMGSTGAHTVREQAAVQARVGAPFDARVVLVADGDTIEAVPSGETRPLRIRLEGIDAPELGEPFSGEATRFVRAMLLRQRVRIDGRDVDRYGRLVARVAVTGRDASTALLEAGLACHFTQFANDPILAAAQSRARGAGAGFWAVAAAKPRCTGGAPAAAPTAPRSPAPDSRRDTHYRGNVRSFLYHGSSCPNANCRNCTRLFATEAEARLAGYKPAGDCVGRRPGGPPVDDARADPVESLRTVARPR